MACREWVSSSIDAAAPELPWAKQHLERGGAVLLRNGVDYVRVIRRGGHQPSTTSNGLVLNVATEHPMTLHSGIRIRKPGQVYLPRKLNSPSTHVSITKYLLADPIMNWRTGIPPDDVSRARIAIDSTATAPDPPGETNYSNVPGDVDGPILADTGPNQLGERVRNSTLAIDLPS